MRVALGTIEIDDETRRKIRKLSDGKGEATRVEVKDYLLKVIDEEILPNIGVEKEPEPEPEPEEEAEVDSFATEAPTDGADREHAMAATSTQELPEPPTRDFM